LAFLTARSVNGLASFGMAASLSFAGIVFETPFLGDSIPAKYQQGKRDFKGSPGTLRDAWAD
jgi:hypothetical protein